MLVHPDWDADQPAPTVIWMHGRTANKELDPGRYLRWLRHDPGIAACAVDLPGHGERLDETLQDPSRTLDVVVQMAEEIDAIVTALADYGVFDLDRLAIGGMSAGGMAALVRLCREHSFKCAAVEATSGSWMHQQQREMFRHFDEDEINRLNPIEHLDTWREIPLLAIHSVGDEWMNIDGQRAFINALRERYTDPDLVSLVEYEQTGAPYEHVGFGKRAAAAKNRQLAFLSTHLTNP